MKKYIYVILVSFLCVILISCNNSSYVTNKTQKDGQKKEDGAVIIVNGKDITNGQYYRYKYANNQTEIPILSVMSELGGKVKWINQNKVKITYQNNKIIYNTRETHFNIFAPPGTTNMTRIVQQNELIVDYASIKGVLKEVFGATITFNDDRKAVIISNENTGDEMQGNTGWNTGDGSMCSDR